MRFTRGYNMKKSLKWIAAASAALLTAGLLTACGSSEKAPAADKGASDKAVTLKVGATPVPHGEILTAVKEDLAKEGVNLEIVEFNDYVQPNVALNDGELDANYFQHKPYLEEFCRDRGMDLVSAAGIHLEPMSVYSSKYKDLKDLPDGAHIAIPNDPTNGARALLLLEKQGLIKLKNGVDPLKAVPQDIGENPKNFNIIELEAPQLPRSLDDTDASIVNAGFASDAGLSQDYAIVVEDDTSPYVNIVAARAEDKDNPLYQQFVKEFQTDEVRQFIIDTCNGALVPGF